MSSDQYLLNILARETVDTSQVSPVRSVIAALRPTLNAWGGTALQGVSPSGSFAKGTANASGTDIDLFLSMAHNTNATLKEIYDSLFAHMRSYQAKKQNVSINVRVNGYDVDLVPAKLQNTWSQDHSLWRHRADTWTKTNVQTHIAHVRGSGRINESRILKLWRDQNGLDFPSFYLEMTVIDALSTSGTGGLASNVLQALSYLNERFANARVVDPANTNNILSDDVTATEKSKIKAAAQRSLNAQTWGEIVK